MKTIIILFIIFTTSLLYSQSVVISTGSEINMSTGTDICASNFGNITGNLTGSGSQCDGPLPVGILSFSAYVDKTNIQLSWQTVSETNNKGFEVQRTVKIGKDNWTEIGFVNGSGTKNTTTRYYFTDSKLKSGKYYYRLKQIDYNGNFEYIELKDLVSIASPVKFELSQNYPNPFNPVTKIDFQLPIDSKVTLKIYDISGREICTLLNNESKAADYYSIEFKATNLSSGIYFYKLTTDNYNQVKKMVIIK